MEELAFDVALQSKDSETLSFADVSVLGLQRSVKVIKKGAKSSGDPLNMHAMVQEALPPKSDGEAGPHHDDDADHEPLSLADVSVLGLQRSAKVTKRPVGASEEVDVTLKDEDTPLSLADVSVLGLQRSAKVTKKAATTKPVEDGFRHGSAQREAPPLSFADVSVLGLQRSAKLIKKPRGTGSKAAAGPAAAAEEPLSLADVSVLGLQRSTTVRPSAAPAKESQPPPPPQVRADRFLRKGRET